MADDLVVREWDRADWINWPVCVAEHNAVVAALLKLQDRPSWEGNAMWWRAKFRGIEAQLAAMTADLKHSEKMSLRCSDDNVALSRLRNKAEAELAAMTVERDELKDQHHQDRLAIETLADMAKLFEAQLTASEAAREKLREVAELVDAWGHGLRHETAHESKMVKAARVALAEPAKAGEP